MAKQVFYLRSPQIRQNLIEHLKNLPLDQSKPIEVEVSPPKRTLSQNRKRYALLTRPGSSQRDGYHSSARRRGSGDLQAIAKAVYCLFGVPGEPPQGE